jgi:hypothetical protein
MDIRGPEIGSARSTAKIETDFGGYSGSTTMLRVRQAYVALDWTSSQILIGQTWHPLFGSVMPDLLNLSTGAPFQPFNRSPQIRFQYQKKKVKFTTSALWQCNTCRADQRDERGLEEKKCIPDFTPALIYSDKSVGDRRGCISSL